MLTQGIALVTGATGFIGSNVTRRLITEGWNVHLLCRKGAKVHLIKDFAHCVSIHTHNESTNEIIDILKEVKPDIVFHLASFSSSEHTNEDIQPLIQSNILFGTQLAEAMIQSGSYQLINTGSLLQHLEGKKYSPSSLYAATKQAFEDIMNYYLQTTPIKMITLKLSNIFGPGDPKPRIFPLLRKAAENGIPLDMSPGEQFIDMVYIDDAVNAYLTAASRFLDGKVLKEEEYVVSSQEPIQLKDLVKVYEEIISKEIPINWGGKPYRPREMMVYQDYGNPLPGWHIKTGLRDGIRKIEEAKRNIPELGMDSSFIL